MERFTGGLYKPCKHYTADRVTIRITDASIFKVNVRLKEIQRHLCNILMRMCRNEQILYIWGGIAQIATSNNLLDTRYIYYYLLNGDLIDTTLKG